jgi:hypothetical protein
MRPDLGVLFALLVVNTCQADFLFSIGNGQGLNNPVVVSPGTQAKISVYIEVQAAPYNQLLGYDLAIDFGGTGIGLPSVFVSHENITADWSAAEFTTTSNNIDGTTAPLLDSFGLPVNWDVKFSGTFDSEKTVTSRTKLFDIVFEIPVDSQPGTYVINLVTQTLPSGVTGVTLPSGNFSSNNISAMNGSIVLEAANTSFEPFVFHEGWAGQGSPIDQDKRLHKQGGSPHTLTYENLINTARGINGIGFEIQGSINPELLSESDFDFQISPQGAFSQADNPPADWQPAPPPSSISVNAGSPDQLMIRWTNNAIENRWLRITVKANSTTGLAEDQIFYIGHLRGETTGPTGSLYTVAFADISLIRSEVGLTVGANSISDIDKNGTVSFADISAMRANIGSQLTNINVP